jgi:hypothetical protein
VTHSTLSERGYESEREELLHTMHDASKMLSSGASKAILEGVLHVYEYATRRPPFMGNRCDCPHCREERLWRRI